MKVRRMVKRQYIGKIVSHCFEKYWKEPLTFVDSRKVESHNILTIEDLKEGIKYMRENACFYESDYYGF